MGTEKVVIAKCVGCGHREEVREGQVPANEVPMCPKCFSPMVAESARTNGGRDGN